MFIRKKGEPARFKRYPYGPGGTRLIMPAVAFVVGVGMTTVGGLNLRFGGHDGTMLICGLVLIPLSAVFFVLALWMAKRNF